jgi:hypothetical protein
MSARAFSIVVCVLLELSLRPAPVWAQSPEVTLADLDGSVIAITSVFQEKIIRNGEVRYPRLHTVWRITVGPGATVATSAQSTSVLPDGRSKVGQRKTGVYDLGKPQKGTARHDTVWVFADASLTRLRVFGDAGGDKMTIAFTRNDSGLHCTLSYPMTPEVGVGKIRKESAVDGTPIQILEYKLVSSTCQIAKGKEPVAAQKK